MFSFCDKLILSGLSLVVVLLLAFLSYGIVCMSTDNFDNVAYDVILKTEDGQFLRRRVTLDPIFNTFSCSSSGLVDEEGNWK